MGNFLDTQSPSIDWKVPVASVFAANSLLWAWCQTKKDNSYVDIMWGLTFILPNALMMFQKLQKGQPIDTRSALTNLCIGLWGLRLAYHIGKRHKEEDYRYVAMRKAWMKGGKTSYYLKSFLIIFVLQAALSLMVNYNSMKISAAENAPALQWTDYAGWAMFAIGYVMEVVADKQLSQHIADPTKGKPKFIQWGLWKYSRHPNYFGEALIWWGIYLVNCSLPQGWMRIFSPLLMSYLLRFLSGVPMLEKKQRKHPEFAAYAAKTNVFVPWFSKEV